MPKGLKTYLLANTSILMKAILSFLAFPQLYAETNVFELRNLLDGALLKSIDSPLHSPKISAKYGGVLR
jgi:hypothetical protein